MVNTAHMDPKIVTGIMTVALVIYMCLQPVFGALSDRIGRKNNMLLFIVSRACLTSVPLLGALGRVTSPYSAASLAPDRAGDRLVLHRD